MDDHRVRRTELPGPLVSLARAQGDVLTTAQASAHGIHASSLASNVASGRWQRIHRGVFATFTGPVPFQTRVSAAVLVAGGIAAATDVTALALYGVVEPEDGPIYVAIDQSRRLATTPGIVWVRQVSLVESVHPVRTPPVVRVDDALCASLGRLGRRSRFDRGFDLMAEVSRQRLSTPARIRRSIERRVRLPGRRRWLTLVAILGEGATSVLERSYLVKVERAHGLPRGERQSRDHVGQRSIWRDVRYRRFRAAIELDGRIGHSQLTDRINDRMRDVASLADDIVTLRIGFEADLRPCETAADVAKVLRIRGWDGRPTPCSATCTILREFQGF